MKDQIGSASTGRRVTSAAALIMFATMFSRITGYLRSMLIYTVMRQNHSDEFLLAFTLPDIAFNLLAGGAMAAALIPVLSSFIAKDKENTGWKAVSSFVNVTFLLVAFLEVIFFIWTGPLLGLIARDTAGRDPESRVMMINLTRILLLNVPFMILSGFCNGILNSYKRFAASAFGPVLYNLFSIISIALFGASNVYLTAWGMVISSFLYFLLQLLSAARHVRHYRPVLALRHPAFKKLARQAVPSIVSSTIVEINTVIGRSYAFSLSSGMLTLLNNANRTWQLPLGIFAQSVGIALLPSLSSHHAENDTIAFRNLLYKGLRAVLLLCIPTTLIMMILNQDIMRAMFKWGSAPESDTFFEGMALLGYSAALIFASVTALVMRAFYALHDSITPLAASLSGIVINIGANWIFAATGIGIAGPALGYTATQMIVASLLLLLFWRKTGFNIVGDNLSFLLKSVLAAIPCGLVLWLSDRLLPADPDVKLMQLGLLAVKASLSLAVFFGAAMLLRIRETEEIRRMVLRRVKKG